MRRFAFLLALLALPALAADAQRAAKFSHGEHASLFPSCTGCHAGIVSGNDAQVLPAAATCARCHDGKTADKVNWTPPARQPGLVEFSHRDHAADAGRDGARCTSCHQAQGKTAWMSVSRAAAEACQSCHTHKATSHFAPDNSCSTCHRTLAKAPAISAERIAKFPKPPGHDDPAFLEKHAPATKGAIAQCAVCHARESCARCHMDAGRNPTVSALAPDPRIAGLVAGRRGAYPEPADHRDADFDRVHGDQAAERPARCGACHAQPSCRSCHTGDGAYQVIKQLPTAEEAAGRGVQLRRLPEFEPPFSSIVPAAWRDGVTGAAGWVRTVAFSAGRATAAPARTLVTPLLPPGFGRHVAADSTEKEKGIRRIRVHPPGFQKNHAGDAAAPQSSCEGCHSKRFCADCHVGGERTSSRRFHAPNFVQRHGPESYGREMDCAACHQTETYCRACHTQLGMGTAGAGANARPGSFHNAQANWFFQHGRAARQELTSCTTCHTQRDCMQCHNATFRGVMPHGPNFDAAAMQKRNPQLCLRCHLSNPLGPRS